MPLAMNEQDFNHNQVGGDFRTLMGACAAPDFFFFFFFFFFFTAWKIDIVLSCICDFVLFLYLFIYL